MVRMEHLIIFLGAVTVLILSIFAVVHTWKAVGLSWADRAAWTATLLLLPGVGLVMWAAVGPKRHHRARKSGAHPVSGAR